MSESQGFLLLSAIVRADVMAPDDPAYDDRRAFAFRVQNQSRDLICSACSEEEMRGWLALFNEHRAGAPVDAAAVSASVLPPGATRSPRDHQTASPRAAALGASDTALSPRERPPPPNLVVPVVPVNARGPASPREFTTLNASK